VVLQTVSDRSAGFGSAVIARSASGIARWSSRWVPSAFVIACLLTLATFAMVLVVARKSPAEAVGYWTRRFWEWLEFAVQMAMIVFTGYVVAGSPPASRLLEFVAGLAG